MEALTFKVPLTPTSKAMARCGDNKGQVIWVTGEFYRKRKVKVMDEEEYVAKVEKIIERDFFPELDKLKAQVESREVGSQPI